MLKGMHHTAEQSHISQFVRAVCMNRTEPELLEAEQNFREFLLVIKEICDRLERDGVSIPSFDEPEQSL